MKRLLIIISTVGFIGCQNNPPEFDGYRAFDNLETQCSFGPRNPGSDGYIDCMNFIMETMSELADTVFTQPFTYTEQRDFQTYDLTNIIAQYRGPSTHHLLIGAHWDTRPWADWDRITSDRDKPIIGANDGASGVAVLMELGRIFHEEKPPVNVTLVFFDGEDLGIAGVNESYAKGSQFFARNLPISPPDEAIIVDMVGDAQLSVPIERNSYQIAPELVKELWQLADKLGLQAFESRIDRAIYDDHIPLWEIAGIPAVDIIDFDYPNKQSNYWHTHDDIPDYCSPESLDQVGTLLVHYIWGKTID